MFKKVIMQSALLAALLGAGFASHAQSSPVDSKGVIPYVIDQRGIVVKNSTGLCWRTGFWTPAAAQEATAGGKPIGCECDPDLLPKSACETAAVAAAPRQATPKPDSDKIKLAADALFDFNKATLRAEGKKKLDELVDKAKAVNLEVIIAVGYTDRIGSEKYNQKLSEKRAGAVKAYLVSKGIDKNRVYTEGKGKTNPVTGDTCKGTKKSKALIACLQPDRRVEIELIGTK